jgi:hypothetical protein
MTIMLQYLESLHADLRKLDAKQREESQLYGLLQQVREADEKPGGLAWRLVFPTFFCQAPGSLGMVNMDWRGVFRHELTQCLPWFQSALRRGNRVCDTPRTYCRLLLSRPYRP